MDRVLALQGMDDHGVAGLVIGGEPPGVHGHHRLFFSGPAMTFSMASWRTSMRM